jgi:exonuclease V gamma subunit
MAIAGQGRNLTLLAINSLAERFSISKKDVQLMIENIENIAVQWPALAREYQVPENMITEIYDYMKTRLLNLC